MREWRATVLVAAVCLATMGALPASAAPGDLDGSFSGDGRVQTRFGQSADMHAVAVGAEGTIVVGGSVDGRMAVVRYSSDGMLDPTFSGDGKTSVGFTGGARGNDMALQPDGKIVVAGAARVDTVESTFAVARFRSNGSLDPSFSGDGRATAAFPFGWAEAGAVAVQPNGRIVMVGWTATPSGYGQVALARFLPTGRLDPTFGVGGTLTVLFADHSGGVAEDVAVQPDGKIVVVGWTSGVDLFIARYLRDGRPDPSFGKGDGVKFSGGTDKQGFALALQPDGKIVVTGEESEWNRELDELDSYLIVGRFLADGRPDPIFGDRGIVRVAREGQGQDVAMASDGSIVAVGTFSTSDVSVGGRFTVARLHPDGTIDDSFGNGNGLAWATFGPDAWADSMAVAIQSNGRILVAGTEWTTSTIAVARFMAS